jgi:peptide/nickel transport system permease protein
VFPCGALGVTLLALNFVGDGLRDAFDPRAK